MQTIFDHCGLAVTHYERVHGGDINDSYRLHTTEKKYFLKVNDAVLYPAMFEKEARGLDALRELARFDSLPVLTIPRVVRQGIVGQQQYLLLEWIDPGNPHSKFWEHFGTALAALHRPVQPYAGWKEDNYIGRLHQDNTRHREWSSFYSDCRIMPLVRTLQDIGGFTKQDVSNAESFCKKSSGLFPGEPFALLHGDFWSGNFMITAGGYPAIYDPAVYYGHREMDIGMTKLFGGFHERFYAAYNEVYPLEKGWQQRLPLTQLYPLLVHAVLFGGHYVSESRQIIREFS